MSVEAFDRVGDEMLFDNDKEDEEWGRFEVDESYTEEEIVQKLKRLRSKNPPTGIDFYVYDISWTERICQEMILTFQHCKALGRHWKDANFHDLDTETNVHAHLVLRAPATAQLFQSFDFSNDSFDDFTTRRPMERQLAISIAVLLRNGRNVSIRNFAIGSDAMSCLANGLVTLVGSGSVESQELHLNYVTFSMDDESLEQRSAEQCLADGLATNKTLTSFWLGSCYVHDSVAAMIVRSLIGHPSLKRLDLGSLEFGELTTRAICCLLASPDCKLSDLTLERHCTVGEGIGAGFDFVRFIQWLPVNTSVQELHLLHFRQHIDHNSANQLLQSLWKLSSLKCLNLTGNTIRDLVRLADNLTMTTPHSCLRELYLARNEFDFGGETMGDEPSTRAILHLLNVFPELGHLGRDVEDRFPPIVTGRLDLNRCSGMLLRGADIPLSVWAIVLFAKVNTYPILRRKMTPSRKANVIYHMLHGPLFAGRNR